MISLRNISVWPFCLSSASDPYGVPIILVSAKESSSFFSVMRQVIYAADKYNVHFSVYKLVNVLIILKMRLTGTLSMPPSLRLLYNYLDNFFNIF